MNMYTYVKPSIPDDRFFTLAGKLSYAQGSSRFVHSGGQGCPLKMTWYKNNKYWQNDWTYASVLIFYNSSILKSHSMDIYCISIENRYIQTCVS
jgi:hypothetical protein